MKRIIEGKIYDTETAENVASWDNGYYGNDFHRCEESLYRTKKGAWFLAGEGGPLSKYARPSGNGRTGGEGLEPISENFAQNWLETNEFTDELERYFKDKLDEA